MAATAKLLSANRIVLPRRLSSITSIADDETDSPHLDPRTKRAIWQSVKSLYRAGMNPGIGFSMRHQGELIFNRTLGHAKGNAPHKKAAQPTLLTPDTPVCLFSASKAVTALLVHHLAHQGSLSLTDKVTRYLPEYGQNGKEETTLYNLLTHRAGVPRLRNVDPEMLFDHEQAIAILCAAKPELNIGEAQSYHAITAGFILAEVIERATGKSINAVLDEVIRQPMNMRWFRYGLEQEHVPLAAENAVTGLKMLPPLSLYLKHAIGATLEKAVALSNDARFIQSIVPAGNLYATAEEASRFYQMLLDNGTWQGKQILAPDVIQAALQPASRNAKLDRTLLFPIRFSAGFMLSNPGVGLYGPNAPKAFGHLGFVSVLTWADPQRALSAALLTTGKGVLGSHMLTQQRVLSTINRHLR